MQKGGGGMSEIKPYPCDICAYRDGYDGDDDPCFYCAYFWGVDEEITK